MKRGERIWQVKSTLLLFVGHELINQVDLRRDVGAWTWVVLIAGHTSIYGNQICLIGRPHILPGLVHTVVDPAAVKQAQHVDVAH